MGNVRTGEYISNLAGRVTRKYSAAEFTEVADMVRAFDGVVNEVDDDDPLVGEENDSMNESSSSSSSSDDLEGRMRLHRPEFSEYETRRRGGREKRKKLESLKMKMKSDENEKKKPQNENVCEFPREMVGIKFEDNECIGVLMNSKQDEQKMKNSETHPFDDDDEEESDESIELSPSDDEIRGKQQKGGNVRIEISGKTSEMEDESSLQYEFDI